MTRLGTPVSVMSMEMAMSFRCSPRFSPLIGVSSPKPLRPCIARQPAFEYKRSPSTARVTAGRREKRVAFADSKGLSLITVRLFCDQDEKPQPVKFYCVKDAVCKTPILRLGFEQPCLDFQAFRCRMRERAVLLESCKATRRSILGTVRVRNICFEKAVHVRISFDAWSSYRDVPCAYLDQCYGEPGTDVFEFNVSVPEQLETGGRIEFCVAYLPSGFSAHEWDNNNGENYCIHVCDA